MSIKSQEQTKNKERTNLNEGRDRLTTYQKIQIV